MGSENSRDSNKNKQKVEILIAEIRDRRDFKRNCRENRDFSRKVKRK